jgi:hypothetical protein
METMEGIESRTTESTRDGDGTILVGYGSGPQVTFIDCTTVVDNGVCHIPIPKFCPFNIRGKNMCGECMYWKARIKERKKFDEHKIPTKNYKK